MSFHQRRDSPRRRSKRRYDDVHDRHTHAHSRRPDDRYRDRGRDRYGDEPPRQGDGGHRYDDGNRGRYSGGYRSAYNPHLLQHRPAPPAASVQYQPHHQPPLQQNPQGFARSYPQPMPRPISRAPLPPRPAPPRPPPPSMQGGYGRHPQPPHPLHHRLGPPPPQFGRQGLLSSPGFPQPPQARQPHRQPQQPSYPLPTGFASRSMPSPGRRGASTAYPSTTSTVSSQEAWDYAVHGFSNLFDKHLRLPKECFGTVKAEHVFRHIEEPIDPAMAELKQRGNEVKGRLDDMDQEVWYRLSKLATLTTRVPYQVRTRFNAEMCTTAWVKMYEMLAHYSLLPESEGPLSTVHVCEAPGAFITATNHYIRTHLPNGESVRWNWTGLSLNPYYEGNDHIEMISVDAFILHTLDRWCFGDDDTGDATRRENIRTLWSRCGGGGGGGVHLFTADGAFDCSASPDEQESLTAHLHFCEAVAGLGCLAKGGNMVLKLFTACERSTAALVYLVGCHFRETFICKPATSKAANSETYLVAKGFEGIDEDLKERLLQFVQPEPPRIDGSPAALLSPSLYPEAFTTTLLSTARFFVDAFCGQIQHVLKLHRRCGHEHKQAISRAHAAVADEFISRCQLRPLPSRLRIVPQEDLAPSRLNTVIRVSNAFAQEVNQGTAGATLKERQAAAKKHKARRQAAIKGTAAGASAAHGIGGGEPVEPGAGQPPNKQARRLPSEGEGDGAADERGQKGSQGRIKGKGGEKAVVAAGDKAAVEAASCKGNEETDESGEMAREVAKYGAFAVSQMGKFGFQKGKGIGREESGISEPIAIQPRPGKLGLGARMEHEHTPQSTALTAAASAGGADDPADVAFDTLLDRIAEEEGEEELCGNSSSGSGGGDVAGKGQLMNRIDWALAGDVSSGGDGEKMEDSENDEGNEGPRAGAAGEEQGRVSGAELASSSTTAAAASAPMRRAGGRRTAERKGEDEHSSRKYDMVYWRKGGVHLETEHVQERKAQKQHHEGGGAEDNHVEREMQQTEQEQRQGEGQQAQQERETKTKQRGVGSAASTTKKEHRPEATTTAGVDKLCRLAAMFEDGRRQGRKGNGIKKDAHGEIGEAGEEEEGEDPEDDLGRDAHYIYNDSHTHPASEEEVASWPLTYRAKVPAISLSRFCRPRIFAKVVDARQAMLPIIAPLLQEPSVRSHVSSSSSSSSARDDDSGLEAAGAKPRDLSLDQWKKLTRLRGELLAKRDAFERVRGRYLRRCFETQHQQQQEEGMSATSSSLPSSVEAFSTTPSCWVRDVEGFLLMRELHERNKNWRFVRAVCLCEQAVAGAGAYLADAGVPVVVMNQHHRDALPDVVRSCAHVTTAGTGDVGSARGDADFEALGQRLREAVTATTTATEQSQHQHQHQKKRKKGGDEEERQEGMHEEGRGASRGDKVSQSTMEAIPRADTRAGSSGRSRDRDRDREGSRGRRRDRSRSLSRDRARSRSRSRDRDSDRDMSRGVSRRGRKRSPNRDRDRESGRHRRSSRRSRSRDRSRRRSRGSYRTKSRSRSPVVKGDHRGHGSREGRDRRQRHGEWDGQGKRRSVYGSADATLWCMGVDVDAALLAGSGKGRLELDTLPDILPQLTVLLASMREGDHAMVRLPDTLSRLGAGVFYILHRSFTRTRVVKPKAASPSYSSSKIVVCEHSLGPSPALTHHLARAVRLNNTGTTTDGVGPQQRREAEGQQKDGQQGDGGEQEATRPEQKEGGGTNTDQQQQQQPPDAREVLELVPMARLLDTRLYPSIVGVTERLLWRQAEAVEGMAKDVALYRLKLAQQRARE